jgi:hypothetical protein
MDSKRDINKRDSGRRRRRQRGRQRGDGELFHPVH